MEMMVVAASSKPIVLAKPGANSSLLQVRF
jgi:hypothetical protein